MTDPDKDTRPAGYKMEQSMKQQRLSDPNFYLPSDEQEWRRHEEMEEPIMTREHWIAICLLGGFLAFALIVGVVG